jgi:putative phage-type endonuclease
VKHAQRVGNFAPGSPEWFRVRANGLGGSEIAAVLGLSPWESRFSLWHRKAGTLGGQADTAPMSWGRRLEAPIADAFHDNHPELKTRRAGGMWKSKARPWQLANPDRFITSDLTGPQILEIKTAHSSQAFEWGLTGGDADGVPIYYRCQCLWYLDTFGLERAHLAVLIGGSDYREFVIDYDEAEAGVMRAAGLEFLTTLAGNQRPPIDESDATYQAVRELHPDIEDIEAEVSTQVAVDYLAACENYANAKADKQLAVSQLLDAMGSARYALHEGQRFAMRVAKGTEGTPFLRPLTDRKAA